MLSNGTNYREIRREECEPDSPNYWKKRYLRDIKEIKKRESELNSCKEKELLKQVSYWKELYLIASRELVKANKGLRRLSGYKKRNRIRQIRIEEECREHDERLYRSLTGSKIKTIH